MENVSLREVTEENWRATLELETHPDQMRFIAHAAPIAAIALAKAYIRPGGAVWEPYAIYAGSTLVGFLELSYTPGDSDDYWLFHFFIDRRFQGMGYGQAALAQLIESLLRRDPDRLFLRLVVHPDNAGARQLYTSAGFRATGETRWDEPVYQLALRNPA